jgi:WD40 repeat protein
VKCSSMHGNLIAFGIKKDVVVYRPSDLAKEREIMRMAFDADVWSVAISPCSTLVVAGLWSGLIEMRSLLDAEFKRVFQGHGFMVNRMLFSLYGSRGDTYLIIISGSSDGTVKIWDSAAGVCMATVDCGTWVYGLALLPGGREVLAETGGDMLIVIGMDGIKKREVQIDGAKVTALVRAGDAVVVGLADGRLQLREAVRPAHVIWSSQVHTRWIRDVCMSPSGAEIATACYDRTAAIVSFTTGEILMVLRGHAGFVSTVLFTPDGSKVITGSNDKTIKTWDLFPKSRKRLSSFIHPIDPGKLLYHGEDVVEDFYHRLKRIMFAGGVEKD